jgi:alpha-L-fucosidase
MKKKGKSQKAKGRRVIGLWLAFSLLPLAFCLSVRAQIGTLKVSGQTTCWQMADSVYLFPSEYSQQGLGALVTWGMPIYFPTASYQAAPANTNVNLWNPAGLNMSLWLNTVQASGAKYAIFTAKTDDGFALWPSTYAYGANPPYNISSTTWWANNHLDPVGLFTSGCRSRGLHPVLYFPIQDQTFEAQSGLTMATGFTQYTNMIGWQLAELLTNYGPITAIWTDAWGWQTGYGVDSYTYLKSPMLRAMIWAHQPLCLQIENAHQWPTTNSQVTEYELGSTGDSGVAPGNTVPAEVVDTATYSQEWYFNAANYNSSANYYAARRIVNTNNYLHANASAYCLALMPDTNGVINAGQITNWTMVADCARWSNNIAFGAAVSVSSTNTNGFDSQNPAVLTDGIIGNYNSAGTNIFMVGGSTGGNENTPYAEVDLGAVKTVNRVEVFNVSINGRTGAMRDLTITILDGSRNTVYSSSLLNPGNTWNDGSYYTGSAQLNVNTGGVQGRYVHVSRNATGGVYKELPLTEIQVF